LKQVEELVPRAVRGRQCSVDNRLRGLDRDEHLAHCALYVGKFEHTPAAALTVVEREHAGIKERAHILTNKQIGVRLFISEKTVASHVSDILNKLGFSSRAQIAGWVASPNQSARRAGRTRGAFGERQIRNRLSGGLLDSLRTEV
jgi:DNA-binding NarL/FixJ family response regulator